MCLKDEIQKLRNQIKREGIRNALQHEAIINFTETLSEEDYGPKRKHGKH